MKKKRKVAPRVLGALCKERELVEFARDGLQAKLQRAKRERGRYADAVIRVQSGAGDLQKLVAKVSSALQQQIEDHRIRVCQHL